MKWWRKINWIGLGGALMLLVGFFLSWVRIEGVETPLAGWQLGMYVPKLGAAYYATYAMPLLALLLGGLSIKKPRWATALGITMGVTVLGWAVFEVARLLYTRTFAGLWVSLAGAALLFVGGLLTWRRGRRSKTASADASPEETKPAEKIEARIEPETPDEELPEIPDEELPEFTDEDLDELGEALEDL